MKVAIVTGASSGIGLALAERLASEQYRVIGVARNVARIPPTATAVEGDVGDPGTAQRAVERALTQFGRLDLLVNNAGIFIAKPFPEYTARDLAQLVNTNLNGFVHMTQRALPAMKAGGHVVNIGTSLSTQPQAQASSALAILIKAGIEAASRALAIEYAERGIRVNTVAAGVIDTPMHTPESHAFLRTLSPANRLGTVDEIADAVMYLERASFVSGEVLRVDGGAHAGRF
ncbi:MAG TPA: SDR family oxidoreductase [Polyangiales bacterium]|nr:SDR family oxidoreductase [Polyangiales bacterium]